MVSAQRLQLKYDEPLSHCPFNFNLRCYTQGAAFADSAPSSPTAASRMAGMVGARGAAGCNPCLHTWNEQRDKISHIDTVNFHIDTVISHIDTVIARSSSLSILSSQGHFHIDTVILSSCGQDDHIISCHSGRNPCLHTWNKTSLAIAHSVSDSTPVCVAL